MKKKIVYLSGPITGIDKFADYFNLAEDFVKKTFTFNVKIINPVILGKKTEKRLGIKRKGLLKPSWQEYMKDCVKVIPDCDYIYMLKGWEKSQGATAEYNLAKMLGIEILYQENK